MKPNASLSAAPPAKDLERETPATMGVVNQETGLAKMLIYLSKEERGAIEQEKKYFKTAHFHYYEGYRHAVQNALGRARELTFLGSGILAPQTPTDVRQPRVGFYSVENQYGEYADILLRQEQGGRVVVEKVRIADAIFLTEAANAALISTPSQSATPAVREQD